MTRSSARPRGRSWPRSTRPARTRSRTSPERGQQTAALARADRRVLPAPRDARLRRTDRPRRLHAARPRRAPRLDHPGGVPRGPRGLADPPGPARRAARDVAPLRPARVFWLGSGRPDLRPLAALVLVTPANACTFLQLGRR